MPLKLLSSGGGSVILAANNTGSNYTVNVPAVNANIITNADSGTVTGSMISSNTVSSSNIVAYSGIPIQYFSTTFTGIGTSSGGSPGTTTGTQLYSGSFTPLRSTSKILIQVSDVCISEESNTGDWAWIGAWRDGNLLAVNSGSALYSHFGGNYNMGHKTFNHTFNSWGTSAGTILIRAGMNQSSSYVNGQSAYADGTNPAVVGISIWEIA